jgi:hypothetical protein
MLATSAKIPTALSNSASEAIVPSSATSILCVARVAAITPFISEKPEKGRLGSTLARERCIAAVKPSTGPAFRTIQDG